MTDTPCAVAPRGRRDGGPGRSTRTIEVVAVGILVLGMLWTLRAAAPVVMPMVLAFVLYLLLKPVVEAMGRLRVPSAVGSLVVLAGLLGAVGLAINFLDEPAQRWLERMPSSLATLERRLDRVRGSVEEVQRAAKQVEEMTNLDARDPRPEVQIKDAGILDNLARGMGSIVVGGVITVAMLYFLLVFGERLFADTRHAFAAGGEPAPEPEVLRHIEHHVSRYLLTITVINACLGIAVGLAMALLDMPNPVLWGAMAAAVNFVPYLGSMVGTVIVAIVGLVTFEHVGHGLVPAAVYAALTSVEGTLITPTILGKTHRMNPLVLFAWIILWGWLWGVGGALLAVPLLVTVKITCDHVPRCSRYAAIIGRSTAPGRARHRADAPEAGRGRTGSSVIRPPGPLPGSAPPPTRSCAVESTWPAGSGRERRTS